MALRNIYKFFASGFLTGYWPFPGSGTFGSLISIIAFIIINFYIESIIVLGTIFIILLIIGFWSCSKIYNNTNPDPEYCVIDEWVGQWITIFFLPVDWLWFFSGFFMFRLLDIYKPFGIKKLEQLPYGFGIMLDDIAAGILGAVILYIVYIII